MDIAWIGKKVYIKLTSGRIYTGKVLEISFIGNDAAGTDIYLVTIKDKFGALVSFSNKEISFMKEDLDLKDGRKEVDKG